MSAREKIVRILEKSEAQTGGQLAATFKARKKADIKVVGFTDYSVTVATEDGDTLRITNNCDTGYNQFVNYLKGKSSVLMPKVEILNKVGDWTVYKSEQFEDLGTVVGEAVALEFFQWASQYSEARQNFTKASRHFEHKRPAIDFIHYGNLRGLLNKIIAYNAVQGTSIMNLNKKSFMVRNGNQIVVTDPYDVA